MISYEVTATVRDDLRGRFAVYMRERHVPDVLLTGLFVGARLLRAEDGRFLVRYELADQATLDRYIATHAPRLRADMVAHFPEGVAFERTTWTELMAWPH